MWISQFHPVLVQKVFGHSALNSLPVFQLEGKTLHLCRFPCDVADSAKEEKKNFFDEEESIFEFIPVKMIFVL